MVREAIFSEFALSDEYLQLMAGTRTEAGEKTTHCRLTWRPNLTSYLISLLEQAKDFPPKGPILIITDGECDKLVIRREHAFLIPKGKHLPFSPWGKVFRFS
jgi:hypothetical protein